MSGLLRISTAGSVDDGKSTLIGRLLYDSKGAYEDQLVSIQKKGGGPLDLALLTDGLRAEREQGITIDVAYRYFSTPKRKFIIADTPGHEQYTRNMATGASTADLAIILVDARNGVLPQSRRHAYIATLLGIRQLVVAVNKMDLADFDEHVFQEISAEFRQFAREIHAADPYFLPISALLGDNVVNTSKNMPWFHGPHLLQYLETAPEAVSREQLPARFPVQYVLRPNLDFRGYAGQVASGIFKAGDTVMALPSGRTSRIKRIATFDGDLPSAAAPQSVTILLEDEIDISRGDMLAPVLQMPQVGRRIEAMMVWMNQQPLETGRTYLLKHTTNSVRASITGVRYRVNIQSLAQEEVSRLELNEIGAVQLETSRPLFFDGYRENRVTGAFILIDALTNETMGAGMITAREAERVDQRTQELLLDATPVTPADRFARTGHLPAVVRTPDSGVAHALERELFERGCSVHVMAGTSEEILRITQAAGLISICVDPEAPSATSEEVLRGLEGKGIIRALQDPFTAGGGI